MPRPTAVLLVVGLTRSLIGPHTPRIAAFARAGAVHTLRPVLPAVTCSVQSSMLTGLLPREHGVVANGWYNAELAEVQFWKQSNRLVQGEKVWETARERDPRVTCANLFWWFNMYSSADYSVTPRPIYKADGRKIPDCYSHPAELRDLLQQRLGRFPLFQFWGPGASIASSQWIAEAAMFVHDRHRPTLTLVYLPHLDYALQKLGPDHPDLPAHLREIDAVVGRLLDYFAAQGVRVLLVSEYGIEPVDDAVPVNRILREAGLLQVRIEDGLELLDAAASSAFAVPDHQVAHVYVKPSPHDTSEAPRASTQAPRPTSEAPRPTSQAPSAGEARGDSHNFPPFSTGGQGGFHVARANASPLIDRVRALFESVPGIAQVLDRTAQAAYGIDHPRSGDLVLIAAPRRWFSYAYWLDDARAPDFARTVDIHRKPGYDPLELFLDPTLRFPKARIAWTLLKRRLGMRALLSVIPLDPRLVRGSHGRIDAPPDLLPVLIMPDAQSNLPPELPCTAMRNVILDALLD